MRHEEIEDQYTPGRSIGRYAFIPVIYFRYETTSTVIQQEINSGGNIWTNHINAFLIIATND
jgi:hypothetical protein